MYSVKQISKKLNLSEHTIRYYTDLGLVPSLIRDKNGHRLFDEQSVNWLIGIKNLRGSGMSIQAVKEYVDLCLQGEKTLEQRYRVILQQKNIIEKQMTEVQAQYQYMTNKVKWYEDIMNHKIEDNSNPGNWNLEIKKEEK
ncbi:MAG TPA: MerR family transcriptional regulator [Erysipelotrichaceae bacterium]|nr:MerR family transcriptional regulator [Erysipelotrichaceae bacterium]